MANNSIENNCGCLYFYSKKGLTPPFYLTRGKTTIGSALQCNIRIKGIENIFCNLDSNEAGFTVLVNSNEDERVLLNGVYANKYSVLSHDDHFQLGDKKFKYCKPDIDEKALECFRKVVATKMLVSNLKSESKRKSTGVYPLKRLQNSSSRRFSTGSRISEIKFLSAVPEKNITLVKTSTPQSASKTRLSQKMSRSRHSALGVLKENETFDFQIDSRKLNSNKKEDLTKLDDSSKAEFKAPTPKKNMLSTGNLKELDINSTVSTCSTPLPTRKKMYSGNLSDVSDFTTPENNISAANITPLNVSKRKVTINKNLLTCTESSTPKSAIRRQRSSSMYRPIVEEITPVSPLPRSSLRISSLKKPSFTQRRSVNFNISSNSDCSLIHSDLVENVSFKPGAKRKRCLSDISGSADKKKITENSKKSDSILAFSIGDSEDEIDELKDTEVLKSEEKETSPNQEKSLSLTTSVGYDSDLEDICISLAYEDTSGRQYIDNSGLVTPDQSLSAGRYTGRKTSIHKHRKSNSYSAQNELAETSKCSRVNSSKVTVDSSFEARDDETPSSGDGGTSPSTAESDKMNSFISSVGKRSGPRRNNVTLPSIVTNTPKKSIDGNYTRTSRSEKHGSSSEESPRSETIFNSSVVSDKKELSLASNYSPKESRSSPNGICVDNDYNAMSDSLNTNLSASDVITRSGIISRRSSRLDKNSFLEKPTEESVIGSRFTGRTSTPIASNRFLPSKSSSGAANDFTSFRRRPNIRSKSLNLRCQTRSRSSINKTTDSSLLMRHLKRRFSVDQSSKSPIVLLRNCIVSTPPSEASFSTRTTVGSSKSSSESLSGNSSFKHTEVSLETTRRSRRNSTNISGRLDISPSNSPASIRIPTTTPKDTSTSSCKQTLDKPIRKISDATETSNFIFQSDDSLSGISLENTNKSFTKTRKSAVSTPTSNSIIYSFVNSSFDGSLKESVVTRRSSRLTRPSIDESVYEISKLNVSSRKSNSDKSATNNRIREWIQSPTVSKLPDTCLKKDDDEIFQASHEKDPTDIKITEAVFSKYLDSPKETPKGEKNISKNYETENDPSDITTLRRLLRTPRKSTASKNYAATTHSAGKFQVSATQNNGSAIIDNNSTTNTSFVGDASEEKLTTKKSSISKNETSNTKEDAKCLGSKMRNSPRNDVSHISSVKKLKASPKIQNSSKNDSTNVAGIVKMLTKPKKQKSPKNDLSNIAGIKKLMATRKIQNSPINDLTNIVGIKKMLTEPKEQRSPKNDLSNIASIKKLMATPKIQNSPKNDLTNIAGIKKMLTTPKKQKSPRNDLSNIAGIKKLMTTPKEYKSPENDLTKVAGIKRILRTPKVQKSPKNDLTNVAGVKLLLQSPRIQKSPRNDLSQVAGVKKLMATPKIQNSPKNDITQVVGVKKLMATPKVQRSPKNDLTHVAGVKKLMATPALQNSPVNDLTNVSGITEMLKTPSERRSAKKIAINTSGVKKLSKTPSNQSSDLKLIKTPKQPRSPENNLSDLRGVKQLLRTPKVKSKSNDDNVFNTINDFELSGIGRLFNESNDSTFDKLLDKKPIRTYIKSPKKQDESNENCIGLDSPAENVSCKNSNTQNLAVNGSTRSGNDQKQLYDSAKESISASDINASETPTFSRSRSQTQTPSKNDASDLMRLLESSRSKRSKKNPHVPTVELDKSSDIVVKVTSSPLPIHYENENNISTEIGSKKGRRKANNKRKHVESDNEKPKKSKICKSKVATRDTSLEIDESKMANTPINNVSTEDGNHIEELANRSFKQGSKFVGKGTRSKNILVQEGTEDEANKPQIEVKMQSKSTRKNDPDIFKESNEDLSENNVIGETKRKKKIVKENSEDSKTGAENSNGPKKEDALEITDYSSGNHLRTRTRKGHKELEKYHINETDSQNVSVDSNVTTKRKLRKVTEKTESGTKNTEIEALNTKTRRGRKKTENDSELDSKTRKGKDEAEINTNVKQNSIVDENIKSTAREKKAINLTDEESNTQNLKKNMKINKISETETRNMDANLKTRTRSRRVKGIGLDNEEIAITNNISENLSTKTLIVKKEKESGKKMDEIEACSDPSESNCRTKTKTKRGKNIVKDYEEIREMDVSCEVVQSRTRRGKKETEKNGIDQTKEIHDCLEQNSKTRGSKYIIQAHLETTVSDVDASKKMGIRTRGNTRNKKETQSNNTTQDTYEDHNAKDNLNTNVENEKKEPAACNTYRSSKKENIKAEKDLPNVTARNTRANRGQNRKYDEIEWHTPVKSPKKIKKNVTFDKNVEPGTPLNTINDSPIRMTRSRRVKK